MAHVEKARTEKLLKQAKKDKDKAQIKRFEDRLEAIENSEPTKKAK